MKVKELVEKLSSLNQEANIYIMEGGFEWNPRVYGIFYGIEDAGEEINWKSKKIKNYNCVCFK